MAVVTTEQLCAAVIGKVVFGFDDELAVVIHRDEGAGEGGCEMGRKECLV